MGVKSEINFLVLNLYKDEEMFSFAFIKILRFFTLEKVFSLGKNSTEGIS